MGGGGEGANERRETIKFSNKRRIKEIVLKFFVEFFFWRWFCKYSSEGGVVRNVLTIVEMVEK